MGKVSLNISQPVPVTPSTPVKTPIQVKSNLLPELTRKEWISVLTAVFIVLSVGFSLGFVTNVKRVNDLSNIVSIVEIIPCSPSLAGNKNSVVATKESGASNSTTTTCIFES